MSKGKLAPGQDMSSGENGDLLGEINSLIREDKLETEPALRLMLKSQQTILKRIDCVEEIARENRDYQKRYPSIGWLWTHHKKTVIFTIIACWLVLWFLFAPLTVLEVREALLGFLGVPVP